VSAAAQLDGDPDAMCRGAALLKDKRIACDVSLPL